MFASNFDQGEEHWVREMGQKSVPAAALFLILGLIGRSIFLSNILIYLEEE